jgi:CTP:molybdopterin cytidylyltransferase MocA
MSLQTQTAGIILAAGTSVRFGQPKQLIQLGDKYLVCGSRFPASYGSAGFRT